MSCCRAGSTVWVGCSLHVLCACCRLRRTTRWTSRCSRARRRPTHMKCEGGPSTGLLPLRSMSDGRLPQSSEEESCRRRALQRPLMRFLAPSAQPICLSPLIPGLPHPVRSVFRVSHPPDGLLLDRLTGLVSCRSAHGVPCPSELFPRTEQPRLSARLSPLAVAPLAVPAHHD